MDPTAREQETKEAKIIVERCVPQIGLRLWENQSKNAEEPGRRLWLNWDSSFGDSSAFTSNGECQRQREGDGQR